MTIDALIQQETLALHEQPAIGSESCSQPRIPEEAPKNLGKRDSILNGKPEAGPRIVNQLVRAWDIARNHGLATRHRLDQN
jgi:hypothetical protein